jgi:hypothetical protein
LWINDRRAGQRSYDFFFKVNVPSRRPMMLHEPLIVVPC